MEQYLTAMILLICAVTDIRKQKIYIGIVMFGAIVGLILLIWQQDRGWQEPLSGVLVGLLLLLTGRCTRQSIGYGDGWLMVMTGIYLGGWQNLELLFWALLLAAVWSVILLVCRKATRKTRLPFVPFLFLSYLGVMLL